MNRPNQFINQSVSIYRLFARFSWFRGLIENRIGKCHALYFLPGGGYGESILNQYLHNPRSSMPSSSRKLTTPIAEGRTFLPVAEGMEKAMWPVPDTRYQMVSALPLQGYAFRMPEIVIRKWPSKGSGIAKKEMEELSASDFWRNGGYRPEKIRLPWTVAREMVKETRLSRWNIASKWPSVSMAERHNREIGLNVLTLVKNTNALSIKANLEPEGMENERDEVSFIRSKAQRAMEEILHEIAPTREREESAEVKGEIERMESLMTGLVNQQRQQLEEVRQLKNSVQTALQELGRPKSLESSVSAMRPLSLRGRL